jgi:hypothetical protein
MTTRVLVLHNVDPDGMVLGWHPDHQLVPVWTAEWPDGLTDREINQQVWRLCNVGDDPDFPPHRIDPERKLALAYRHKATIFEHGIRSLSMGDAVVIADESPDPVRAYPFTRDMDRRWTVADLCVTQDVPQLLEGQSVLDADALKVWRTLPGTRDKLLGAGQTRPGQAPDAAARGGAPRDGHCGNAAPHRQHSLLGRACPGTQLAEADTAESPDQELGL